MSQMPYGPLPTPVPSWAPQDPVQHRTSSKLIAAIAAVAVLSLAALGVAAAAWFRSSPSADAEKSYSEQEQTSAREAVCSAHAAVKDALTAATHQPEAKEPGNNLLIAVNIRLAEYASADYLSQQLAAYPATPKEISDPASGLVATLRRLAMGQLGDAPADKLQPLTEQIGSLTDDVTKACAGHT